MNLVIGILLSSLVSIYICHEKIMFLKFISNSLSINSTLYNTNYNKYIFTAKKLANEIEQYVSDKDIDIYNKMKIELDQSIDLLHALNNDMRLFLEQYMATTKKYRWRFIFTDKYKEEFESIKIKEV